MNSRFKRGAALAVSMTLLTALAACSGNPSTASAPASSAASGSSTPSSSGASASSQADSVAVQFPLPEPVEYTYMIPENPNYKLIQDGEIMKYFQELTNVRLVYQPVPNESYTEKYNTMLASGNVPDISKPNQAYRYGPQGLFVNIMDHIDAAPNFKKIVENPAYKPYLVCVDGGVYNMSTVLANDTNRCQYVINYRKDILDELGMQEPTDEAGWYELFKAVKAKYPNMTPFSFPKDEWRFERVFEGYYLGGDLIGYDDISKTWSFMPDSENYKAAITFASKLYSEGLLDQEYISITKNDLDQKIFSGQCFAAITNVWAGGSAGLNKMMAESGGMEGAVIAECAPWGTQFGPRIVATSPPIYPYDDVRTIAFSSKIKNPETAIAYFDFVSYDEKNAMVVEYGIEGKHWEMTEHGPDYMTEEQIAMRLSDESVPTNLGISDRMPRLQNVYSLYPEAMQNWVKVSAEKDPYSAMTFESKKKLVPFLDTRVASPIKNQMSEEQISRTSELQTLLKTIFYEYRTNLVTGKVPMSEWDAMLAMLKKNGSDELITIYNEVQTAFNATISK